MTRKCGTCGFVGDESLFRHNRNQCLVCRKAYLSGWRREPERKEDRKMWQKTWADKHPEYAAKVKQKNAEIAFINKMVVVARVQARKVKAFLGRVKRCKDCGRHYIAWRKKYQWCASCSKAWRDFGRKKTEKHRSLRRAAQARWGRKQYRADSKYHIRQVIQTAIRNRLKSVAKREGCWRWLEYTPEQLEARLRETMPEGYAWDAFMAGALHIDHIKPVAAFSFETMHDVGFKECFALSNLQLLPASENLRKNAWFNGQHYGTQNKQLDKNTKGTSWS